MAASTPPRRLLVTETCDPNGAMFRWLSPDVTTLGWHVRRLPGQDLIHHLGHTAFQRLVVSSCEQLRPHVLVVHPPYDHLGRAAAERIRALGTRLVAFAFDDPIVRPRLEASGTWAEACRDIEDRFDLYATTDRVTAAAACAARCARVRFLRWAASPAAFKRSTPVSSGSPAELESLERSVVMVGRAYPHRVELVAQLAAAGLPVAVFGAGWRDNDVAARLPRGVTVGGFVPGPELPGLLRRSGVVVTPADWADRYVPMVKYRLLEAAFAGACQLARDVPGLADYFDPDELPTFGNGSELVDRAGALLGDAEQRTLQAAAARARALRDHTWSKRWPELLALLGEVERPLAELPDAGPVESLDQCLAMLAHEAEQAGRSGLAAQLFGDLVAERPDDVTALAGLARLRFDDGRPAEAAELLERALAAAGELVAGPPLYLRLPAEGAPSGLGRARFLRPDWELTAYRIAALLEAGKPGEAMAVVEAIDDDDALATVASLLQPDEHPGSAPVWRRLFERALQARPVLQEGLKEEQEGRWREALAALTPRP